MLSSLAFWHILIDNYEAVKIQFASQCTLLPSQTLKCLIFLSFCGMIASSEPFFVLTVVKIISV